MSAIVGTITSVQSFLEKNEITLTVNPNLPQERKITLQKNRKYTIPAYQREIRWSKSNVNVLLSDLLNGPRFLGNVILSLKQNGDCEIIDGQQRTTVLYMIIECLRSLFGDEIELFQVCELENYGFKELNKLIKSGFSESSLNSSIISEINKSDIYRQKKRFVELWENLKSSTILNNRYQAKNLLNNLKLSELNIIASQDDNENVSIRYFLDVNLKGIRLDVEDIFKGYLFSQDSREQTRVLWQNNKQRNIDLNAIKKGKADKRYPLMKLYEHFFYCDLFLPKENEQDFNNVVFGEDFCLSQHITLQSKDFYEGTHIIEVIQNSSYLQKSLQRINKSLEIMIDIISSEGPSDEFKSLFLLKDGETLDSIEKANIHFILKKIILDTEIIPKVLALKYIISFFDDQTHSKAEYKSIYSVFTASVIFNIFATKKESKTFYSFAKKDNTAWIQSINQWIAKYVASHELTRGKVSAAYKYTDSDDDEAMVQQIRSKSLAAICNYIIINTNTGNLKVKNCKEFNQFLTNKNAFSIEHFIIGESGSLKIKTNKFDFTYKYPNAIKKYRNSLFNYIFIPDTVNNELGNTLISAKLKILKEYRQPIKCKYSNKYIDLISGENYFKEYPNNNTIDKYESQDEATAYLDSYFSNTFPTELLEFASELTKHIDI